MATTSGGARFDAVLFDLDGVLTATARVHEAAWKEMFDAFMLARADRTGTPFEPFTTQDYLRYVDGKIRSDGVRSFLTSRGISLPEGTPESPPEEDSIHGLGTRKNQRVEALIRPDTVEVFPGAVVVVRALRAHGVRTAVVSSSANARAVLAAAGITGLFDVVVDGSTAAERKLAGKPAPDMFLEAAREVGVSPERAMVVEDAVAGVRAARDGGFGLVVGIGRRGTGAELWSAGANLVISDLWVLLPLAEGIRHGPKLHRMLARAKSRALMSRYTTFHPWALEITSPAPEMTPQLESMLALSNGYLGIRGSVEEGAPSFRPVTLLNGFYETWPIHYPEEAFGLARTGQTIVAAPDGMRIRLFVDDSQFDPPHVDLLSYSRTLHLDRGVLERKAVWRLSDGARVAVRSWRLASLVQRHLALLVFEIDALDRPVSVTLSSELADPSHLQAVDDTADPRRRSLPPGTLQPEGRLHTDGGALRAYTTRQSGLAMACGMEHVVRGDAVETTLYEDPRVSRYVISGQVAPGRPLRVEKFLSFHHSGRRVLDELMFRVGQTLKWAQKRGARAVRQEHEERVQAFWRDADIEIEGSDLLQFATRFGLFQLMQATARVEGNGLPAKGLTGEGYEGHVFWDTEIYVLPFLDYTRPNLARSLLMHRYRMLDEARRRARDLRHSGALFPWRTINGEEASPYYAAGTAQYHLNADIAYAIRKYVDVTGDRTFLEKYGAEMLVETARMWADLGYFSEHKEGRFVINAVTGPDEYSTVVDNNTYTNLMARENLQMAAQTVEELRVHRPEQYDDLVKATRLQPEEPSFWRRAAEAMYIPYDEDEQVHPQDDAFLNLEPWDFEGTSPNCYPLLLHFHPLDIYRHQVIKQADVMLAAFLLGNEFSPEAKRRIWEYYDPITTGDSSLSECIQSIVACDVGEVPVAHRYLMDSVSLDLADLHGNVRDGIHVASCGGTWMAFVYGFAGMRDYDGAISFRPVMPPHWSLLRFRLRVRGSVLEVQLRRGEARYRLLEGPPLVISHRGQEIAVSGTEEHRVNDPQMWTPEAERAGAGVTREPEAAPPQIH